MGTCTGMEVFVQVDSLNVEQEREKLTRKHASLEAVVADIEKNEAGDNYTTSVSAELREANTQRKSDASAELASIDAGIRRL